MANTTTAYFTSNKFDLTEWTALLTLWMAFMFKGLTATLYSIADWLEDQIIIQFGIQGLTLTESQPVTIEPAESVTIEPATTIEPSPVTIEPAEQVKTEPAESVTIEPVTIEPESVTLSYKDLQAMLKEYRDTRGKIQVKLNAKKSKLLEECKRLGLAA